MHLAEVITNRLQSQFRHENHTEPTDGITDLSRTSFPLRPAEFLRPPLLEKEVYFVPGEVKALIFDFDGTIANTERLHRTTFHLAAQAIISQLIGDPNFKLTSEDIREFHPGFGKPERITCETIVDVINRKYNRSITPVSPEKLRMMRLEQVSQGLETEQVAIVDGLPELIEKALSRGKSITICTGSSRQFVDPVLNKLGLTKFFPLQHRIYANDYPAEYGKPDPYPYTLSLKRLSLNPHAVITFEDSASGVISGLGAGLRQVIVRPSAHYPKVLGKMIESFSNIHYKWLESKERMPVSQNKSPSLADLNPKERLTILKRGAPWASSIKFD